MRTNLIPQLFDNISDELKRHLDLDYNERIIFTGKFGTGKTTFLNTFFDDHKKDYNVIHLYPVNYSVLSNEDIFSYIKYDIIYELLEKDYLKFDRKDFNVLKDGTEFIQNNIYQISALFLLLIPKMGRQYYQLSQELENLFDNFNKHVLNENDENIDISSLTNTYYKKDHELYEFNATTLMIYNSLKELKGRNNQKKNILIIDDLDRIDPHHIFRLFNVFTAQFDRTRSSSRYGVTESKKGLENKFGFDHIFFVCDIGNIKNIYQHIYGIKTDFNGYVDKFYSREIFHFDTSANIMNYIDQFFNKISFIGDSDSHTDYLNRNAFLKTKLVSITSNLVLNNQLNLRSLIKNYEKRINLDKKELKFRNSKNETVIEIPDRNYSGLHFIRILSKFFIDYESLKKSIEVCSKYSYPLDIFGDSKTVLLGEIIMILDKLKKGTSHFVNQPYSYKCKENNLIFEYKVEYYSKELKIFCAKLTNTTYPINISMYFKYLVEVMEVLKERGYIK